jgi:hypothetical protein
MNGKKSNDLKDIIESSYVTSDYGDNYYDRDRDSVNKKTNNRYYKSNTQMQTQTQTHTQSHDQPSSIFRNDTGCNRGNSDNIFLKKSQNIFSSNINNTNNTSNMGNGNKESDQKKIELNEDNFPSLGSKNTTIKTNNAEKKLDFKKVVEKKSEVINKPEIKTSHSKKNKSIYGSDVLYYGIKEKSEKIAYLKMVNDNVYSDDDGDIYDDY